MGGPERFARKGILKANDRETPTRRETFKRRRFKGQSDLTTLAGGLYLYDSVSLSCVSVIFIYFFLIEKKSLLTSHKKTISN